MKPAKSKNISFIILTLTLFGIVGCSKAQEKKGDKISTPSVTIQEAAFFGNMEAIKEHIVANSDLNEKDAYGSTPLHIASMFGKTEAALLLIEAGADLNLTSADGSTPLHTASFFCHTEIVISLLENNVDINIRNAFGITALESLSGPFVDAKPIYEELGKTLGPLGLRLDYKRLEDTRPIIAKLILESGN